jgi:hypothetical protein
LVLQQAEFAAWITANLDASLQSWSEKPSNLVLIAIKIRSALKKSELRVWTEVPNILISDPIQEDLHVELHESEVNLIVFRPFSTRAITL